LASLRDEVGEIDSTILKCDKIIDISSTQIRENPAKYAEFLAPEVYQEYLKVSESEGLPERFRK